MGFRLTVDGWARLVYFIHNEGRKRPVFFSFFEAKNARAPSVFAEAADVLTAAIQFSYLGAKKKKNEEKRRNYGIRCITARNLLADDKPRDIISILFIFSSSFHRNILTSLTIASGGIVCAPKNINYVLLHTQTYKMRTKGLPPASRSREDR